MSHDKWEVNKSSSNKGIGGVESSLVRVTRYYTLFTNHSWCYCECSSSVTWWFLFSLPVWPQVPKDMQFGAKRLRMQLPWWRDS